MTWQIFERSAANYEAWYATRRGRRADAAERRLLLDLLDEFRGARTVLEIGCGTGHFAAFLARQGFSVVGVDRAPAMLAEARRRFSLLPVVLADAHRLPFRDKSADLSVFVTTLEFLEDPACALREAVRIARQGVIAVALNRYSLGGVSRRWGLQSRGALLSLARDYSPAELRLGLEYAAGARWAGTLCASTLLPGRLSQVLSRFSLGEVIGCALRLKV